MEIEVVHRFKETIPGVCPNLEGPHWDESTNTLLYVDFFVGRIHRWNPETKDNESIQLGIQQGKILGFAVPARKGGLIAAIGLTLSHVDWETQKVTCLHEVNEDPKSNFNDGKCDPRGRIWAGTFGELEDSNDLSKMDHIGHLYSLDVDGSITERLDKIGISNGLAWTQDTKTMYFVDSIPRKVYAFDYDISDASIKRQRTVVEFKEDMGIPDGMTIDNEGKIWVAGFNGGKVFRFDPETGKQLQSIKIPAKRVTSCCFGGKNHDELYITSSLEGADEEETKSLPRSGSLFRVKGLGVKGFPSTIYEGPIKL
ncbi:hypothetical protein FSP39_023562 [Pinctada imbricata]|uniref:Regucalcin n=1 Tax=Pinctada imbricata TaxID=66713 RepID=A0AA89BZU2_PINIB|nr:hypothetical protein FSP39_023562 [Pinctada imbricata]